MQETINKQQRENNRRKRLEEDAEDVKRREEKNGKFVDPLYIKHPKMVGEDVYKTRSTHDMVPFNLCLLGCVFILDEYPHILQQDPPHIFQTVISKFGGVLLDKENSAQDYTHVLCATQKSALFQKAMLEGKRCVTVYWLNDVIDSRTYRPPWQAIHLPVPYSWSERPADKHVIAATGFHQKERILIKSMLHVAGASFSISFHKSCSLLICKRPQGVKYQKALEWNVPVVNMTWLRDVINGVTSFQPNDNHVKLMTKDFEKLSEEGFLLNYSVTHHMLESWKRHVVITPETLQMAKVRNIPLKQPHAPAIMASQYPIVTQQQQQATLYRPQPKVAFTGFTGSEESEMKRSLHSKFGPHDIQLLDRADLATHLVAKTVVRTQKFLACLCQSAFILSSKWVKESVLAGRILEELPFELSDRKAEERHKFKLQESKKRAANCPVFRNCLFFVTQSVTPDHHSLKPIVVCGGGKMINKIPQIEHLKHLQSRTIFLGQNEEFIVENQKAAHRNDKYFVISSVEDAGIYRPMRKQGIVVHSAELILTSALKQQIDEELYRLS